MHTSLVLVSSLPSLELLSQDLSHPLPPPYPDHLYRKVMAQHPVLAVCESQLYSMTIHYLTFRLRYLILGEILAMRNRMERSKIGMRGCDLLLGKCQVNCKAHVGCHRGLNNLGLRTNIDDHHILDIRINSLLVGNHRSSLGSLMRAIINIHELHLLLTPILCLHRIVPHLNLIVEL